MKNGGLKRFFAYFLPVIFLVFLSYSISFSAEIVRLDKPKVRLIIPPGQSKTGRIEVTSSNLEPIEVKLVMGDWVLVADEGSKKFLPAGTVDSSCAKWIDFAPAEFTIPALGKEYVNYTVRVPDNAKGGYYAVLFFESIIGRTAVNTAEDVNVPLAIRLGSLFYIETEGTIERKGIIEKLDLQRQSNEEPLLINLGFLNTGNIDIIAAGNFSIIDKKGLVYARGEFDDKIYTLPGDRGKLIASVAEALPKGKYDLIITLDLGKALEELAMGRGPLMVNEAEIEIGGSGEVVKVGELK